MSKIYIAHYDPAVRKALIQTLKSVMPEADFADDTMPESASDTVFEAASDGPQPLKVLIDAMTKRQLRRKRPAEIALGNCRLDVHAREFFESDGESVMLTEKEVDVLVYLFQRKTPATRDDLLKDVWNYAADVDTHTIETHIYRLRQKIEPDAEHSKILLTTKDGYSLAMAASNA